MAYNVTLAKRVRNKLSQSPHAEEKKMMGGLTFMVNGKMCVGILKDELMARIDPEVYETALRREGCHEMNFTGKPMRGFVFVSPKGTSTKKDLDYWIDLALDFNKKAKVSKKTGKKNHNLIEITELLTRTHPKLFTQHQLEFKNVFGAVGGYVNGRIFASCGKFGVAFRLPPDKLAELFRKKEAGHLKYFPNGHVKKEYAVLSKRILENKSLLKMLVNESIKYVLSL